MIYKKCFILINMEAERNAYGRTNIRATSNDPESKDPIESLKGKIEAIILDNDIFDYKTIEYLLDKIDEIDREKAKFLNPVAFILGYLVLTKNNIDLNLLKKVTQVDRIIEEYGVGRIDILRYARFWLNVLSNNEKEKKNYEEKEDSDNDIIEEQQMVFEKEQETEYDKEFEDEDNEMIYDDYE